MARMTRKPYPSDVSDDEWALVASYLALVRESAAQREHALRGGFNGLRYVLTAYTMDRPLLRRASVYLCVIGAAVLLVLGAGALLNTLDSSAIAIAEEAARNLHP